MSCVYWRGCYDQSAGCQFLKLIMGTRVYVVQRGDRQREVRGDVTPHLNVPAMRKEAGQASRANPSSLPLSITALSPLHIKPPCSSRCKSCIFLHRPDNISRHRSKGLVRARTAAVCAAPSYGALRARVPSSSIRSPRSHDGALSLRLQRSARGAWHSSIAI